MKWLLLVVALVLYGCGSGTEEERFGCSVTECVDPPIGPVTYGTDLILDHVTITSYTGKFSAEIKDHLDKIARLEKQCGLDCSQGIVFNYNGEMIDMQFQLAADLPQEPTLEFFQQKFTALKLLAQVPGFKGSRMNVHYFDVALDKLGTELPDGKLELTALEGNKLKGKVQGKVLELTECTGTDTPEQGCHSFKNANFDYSIEFTLRIN